MMLFISIILAFLAHLPLITFAAPHTLWQAGSEDLANNFLSVDELVLYSGPWSNFPKISQWKQFDDMFNANVAYMLSAGSTQQDVDRIRTALTTVGATYGIEARVLLGMMMQESHGSVGVPTTYNVDGVATGGLMQASGCHGFDGQNNLAPADITYMIDCGTQHFKTNLATWGGQNSEQTIYPALREYNSGSVVADDLSVAPNGAGDPEYVRNIANRLLGWVSHGP